jgi:hypothetical protein
MRVICKPRRAGKTTDLIKMAAQSQAYIVVMHRREAQRIAEQAEEMGLDIRFPVTFEELLQTKMVGSFVRNIIIDNADILLERLLGNLKIECISLTEEDTRKEGAK